MDVRNLTPLLFMLAARCTDASEARVAADADVTAARDEEPDVSDRVDASGVDPTADAAVDPVPDVGYPEVQSSDETASGEQDVAKDTPPFMLADLTLNSFPHRIDLYSAGTPSRAVIFLHGGGGTKEGGAAQLGLDTSSRGATGLDASWLAANDVVFVIPQGQALEGTKGNTWDNYVMTSGIDDMGFLVALVDALRTGQLDASLPPVGRVTISGHSNGGMMVNRLWCEASESFDAYVAFAGPASVHLGAAGDHPCAPTVTRPFLAYVGGKDGVLRTEGNWEEPVWTIAPLLAKTPGFVDPKLVSDLEFHTTVRVPLTCGEVIAPPTTSPDGATTTWSDCGGTVRLVLVAEADHCLSGATCTSSLESETGQRMVDVLMDFTEAYAP